MKKYLLLALLVFIGEKSFSKIVKFSVDMSGQVIDTNGIHITGDFQAAAGFAGGNWMPNTTEMILESGNIYSVTVTIPAFAKYEFKFLNGDATYALEFVPIESRVDEVLDDNRWIYIDSLDNDTMKIPAIRFSGNAPMGQYLLRLKVNMQDQTPASSGVHVSGSFQGNDAATTRLCDVSGNGIFQYHAYLDSTAANAQWRYVNGNQSSAIELISGSCINVNDDRNILLAKDSMLAAVCFGSCVDCFPLSAQEIFSSEKISSNPNPFSLFTNVELKNISAQSVLLLDVTGRMLRSYETGNSILRIEKENLSAGLYFLKVMKNNGATLIQKLIVE